MDQREEPVRVQEPTDRVGDVELTIKRFSPNQIPPGVWDAIGPTVRDVVSKSKPRGVDQARELLTRTAFLAYWCHQHAIEVRPEVMLAPNTIDRFVIEGLAHLTEGSRANYRSLLRQVGAAVLGPKVYPPQLHFGLAERPPPYPANDLTALVGWSRGLPTPRMRDGAQTLLGLGAGAGLTSVEVSAADAQWVESGEAGLDIVIPGERARRVPVLPDWEWAVRVAVERARGGLLFLPQRSQVLTKQVSQFVEGLPRHDAPKLSARRLRSTWIVRLLDAHVPLNAIVVASGVQAEHVASYARYMAPVTDDVALRMIRGRGR